MTAQTIPGSHSRSSGGKTNALPQGFVPCQNCLGSGNASYTLLKELKAWEGSGPRMTLIHWCDKGSSLSGGEIFKRRTAHGLGDISLQASEQGGLNDLYALWKAINS